MSEFPDEAAAWIETLGLEPLEHEGGLFRRVHLDEHSSAIYYLLADPEVELVDHESLERSGIYLVGAHSITSSSVPCR